MVISFREALSIGKLLIYDGGFGTELFALGVDLPNSSLANEFHQDAVRRVTASFIEAGSEIVQTNTFVASPLHLRMAGRDADSTRSIVSSSDAEISIWLLSDLLILFSSFIHQPWARMD